MIEKVELICYGVGVSHSFFMKSLFSLYLVPKKLYVTLTGAVKERWPTSEGTYTLGPSLLNRQPYWLKKDGEQAIWYDKDWDNWKMAGQSHLWTSTSRMLTTKDSAEDGAQLPHRITPWKYMVDGAWTASSEIKVQNTGKFRITNQKY